MFFFDLYRSVQNAEKFLSGICIVMCIRFTCFGAADSKQEPVNMVAFPLEERQFFLAFYVFGLISPLFGLALSPADAFWESLQSSVTRQSR